MSASGPGKHKPKKNKSNDTNVKAKVLSGKARAKATLSGDTRPLEDWEKPFVRDWDAIYQLTHMRGLPQFRPKPQDLSGGNKICPLCGRNIASGTLASHDCSAITTTVPNVRKRSTLPRKQRYVKVKSGFQEKLSDYSGGWW